MPSSIDRFETIACSLLEMPQNGALPLPHPTDVLLLHAFDNRNIHPRPPTKVKRLFDDGHYAEATFHAFKYLDKQVQRHSKLSESGFKLMMNAFDYPNPKLPLTPLKTESDKDAQRGYRFVFAGGVQAIRNPRGHEYGVVDDPDTCLDHLSFVSMLLRRLETAGYR